MAKLPVDPLRVKMMDLLEEMTDHLARLRDHASVPGNAWLAKGELRLLSIQASELEMIIEEIEAADQEDGF
jgi:hypothetical protein